MLLEPSLLRHLAFFPLCFGLPPLHHFVTRLSNSQAPLFTHTPSALRTFLSRLISAYRKPLPPGSNPFLEGEALGRAKAAQRAANIDRAMEQLLFAPH